MFSGYYANEAATQAAWRNGWFRTGDRVRQDAHGTWHFIDRIKDAIRRRGENVSAWEVEAALREIDSVEDAAVFAVPADIGDDEVMAAVQLRSGETPDPEALSRRLQDRLPDFAIPRYLEFVAALPLTDNGKVVKAALRERGVTEAAWDRQAAASPSSRGPGR